MAEITSAAERIANYSNKLNTARLPAVLLPLKDQMIQRFTDYIEPAVEREITTQEYITTQAVPVATYVFYQAATRNAWKRYISNNSIWDMTIQAAWIEHWTDRGLDETVLTGLAAVIFPA
jgi:hypothetical protein